MLAALTPEESHTIGVKRYVQGNIYRDSGRIGLPEDVACID